jgi:hypothetical protein
MKKREKSALFYAVGAISVALGGVLLGPLGCSDDDPKCADSQSNCDPTGSGGTGGSGGAGGTGGAAGSGGTAGSSGSAGAGGSGEACGGFASLKCSAPDTMYCDFAETVACGASDGTGTCMPRPDTCVAGGPGVCGCDGKPYTNACEAHRAGTDDHPTASCSAP